MRFPRPATVRTRDLVALCAVLGAGVVGVAAFVVVGGSGGSADIMLNGVGAAAVGETTAAAPIAAAAGRFGIAGHASGLYPGASVPLELMITNPEPYDIVVTSITTTVGTPSAGCPGSLLTVTAFAGNQTVPAHASRHVTVTVSLAHAATNACQGVTFAFHYAGIGKRV